MADINSRPIEPVEGDGVNYSGIVWFIVILVVTVVVCQVIVLGLFKFAESRVVASDVGRAPLAAPAAAPRIERGHLVPGGEAVAPGAPGLLVDEPTVLREFRHAETEAMTTYGWVNRGSETVRLPIERAKAIVLERGLPTRQAAEPAATSGETK